MGTWDFLCWITLLLHLNFYVLPHLCFLGEWMEHSRYLLVVGEIWCHGEQSDFDIFDIKVLIIMIINLCIIFLVHDFLSLNAFGDGRWSSCQLGYQRMIQINITHPVQILKYCIHISRMICRNVYYKFYHANISIRSFHCW